MTERMTLSRRELLRRGAGLVVVASTSTGLVACEEDKLNCTDTTGLNQAARQLREALEYQDVSPHGQAQDCNNCQFFRAAKKGVCGACTLVQGPINPAGYCNSWAPKDS